MNLLSRRISLTLLVACVTFAVFLVGGPLGKAPLAGAEPSLHVVTTIYPLTDIAKAVGGDLVNVSALLSGGDSPHVFEARPRDVRRIADADFFIWIGKGLDDWAARLFTAGGRHTQPIVVMDTLLAVSDFGRFDAIDADDEHETMTSADHGHHIGPDPHVWLDPLLVRDEIAPMFANAFSRLRPESASVFQANLTRYQEQLTELHEWVKAELSDLSRREFVSYHSAWRYFAQRYGLTEAATIAEFPGQEPSARWLADVVKVARQLDVDVIFAEPQLNPKAATLIAQEVGATVLLLDPLGGEHTGDRQTYLDLMRFNVTAMAKALR